MASIAATNWTIIDTHLFPDLLVVVPRLPRHEVVGTVLPKALPNA